MLHAAAAITALFASIAPLTISAQGVTTAGVRGTVTTSDHRQPDALVRVADDANGFAVEVRVRNGRYFVQGLQPGAPYTVTARAIGYDVRAMRGVILTLGELRELNLELTPLASGAIGVVLQTSEIRARRHDDGGTGTTIPNASIDQLPTLNRDLYDFVRLVPQISTKINIASPGLSAGGAGFRYNSFLINGVSERSLSGGVSAAFAGNKSVPLGAVQEYEVLLAPYDVRYGDFAGALINTITKSGTNEFTGSVFANGRNDRLRRAGDSTSIPYDRAQYGFTLGGPIIRNRLHFFIAPEVQHYTYPADGPYLGQPANASFPMRVSTPDLSRFDAIMRSYGLTAGSAGAIENSSPLRNVFARVDLAVPKWNSRVVAWHNFGGGDDRTFSRSGDFSLSSYQVTRRSRNRLSAIQLLTALGRAGGGSNELLVSYKSDGQKPVPDVFQPIVRVSVPAVSGGGNVTLNAGTSEFAHGGRFRSSSLSVKDNLTVPLGASHAITLGAELELFQVDRGAAANSYGTWSFRTLDDFERGVAERYDVWVDRGRPPVLRGSQYALYTSDQWQPHARVSLTAGLRSDLLTLDGAAPYEPSVDSIFGRRTDQMPRARVELSPRLGGIWNIPGVGRQRLRGGAGIFTGRYPLAWAHAALSAYGAAGGLQCGLLLGTSALYPPAFNPDYRTPPQACAGNAPLRTDVNLLDRNLRMVRVARASVAYERSLVYGLRITGEALGSRSLSDFAFQNINLPEPVTTDRNGRVMYGTLGPTGTPSQVPRSNFAEVIDLRNVSGNTALQLSATLESDRTKAAAGSISYTYSHVADVQTPNRVNTRGSVAWSSARVNAGRDDDLTTTSTSANEIPHRVIVAGTWTVPWKRLRSELAFYYVGESGRPFTFTSFGVSRRGDLNADGSNSDDPIFIPNDARDANEVGFAQPGQSEIFERFISARPCLNRQRGRIMDRNSCYEPWSNTTIASVRQTIPMGKRAFEAQLDAFNVLNLVNQGWGLRRTATTNLLEHLSQTGSGQNAQPVFALNPVALKWTSIPSESSFQLQLAARYRF